MLARLAVKNQSFLRLSALRLSTFQMLGCLLLAAASPLPAQQLELQQSDGGLMVLPHPAKTIITLSPHLTELAFAAGAGPQLIAAAEYSNYPAAASDLPRVGDAFRLDLERIISLQPDLVIAWESGNPALAVSRLQEFGLNTWVIEIRRPEEIANTLERLGAAAGQIEAGREAARQVRQRLAEISESGAGKPKVSYFYQVAEQPLFTLNGQHLISQSLALCGGENIFATESVLAPQISLESVIVRDPEVMFAAVIEAQPDPLAAWQQWPKLQAVRNQRLYTLPADQISRATPRMLDAIVTACG
ncbi:MAG TPA: cobalamin-binding protein, partial [Xanthomonadales bacterium]|nr:cobalamin-binding protein [Xanthomonadales bacterium]